MKVLIDTHVLLWLLFKPKEIPDQVMDVLNNPEHEIKVSSMSFVEIALKFGKGNLDLNNIRSEELIPVSKKNGLRNYAFGNRRCSHVLSVGKNPASGSIR